MQKLDKYAIPHATLQKVDEILADPEKKLTLHSVKNMSQGLYQLLLWIKAIVALHKIVNPLLFVSADYVRKRLAPDEVELVEYIYQSIENWKLIYTIRLRNNEGKSTLSNIISESKKNLSGEYGEYVNLGRWEESNKICMFYFNAKEKVPTGAHPALVEKVLTEFFTCFKEVDSFGFDPIQAQPNKSINLNLSNPSAEISQSIINSSNIMATLKTGKKNISIEATLLDHKILAVNLLFYADVQDLKNCSLINKHWHKGVKMHMILRAISFIEETKDFQEANKEIAERIDLKRKEYYEDYEINPPTKESALQKMSALSSKVSLLY